MIKVEGFDEKIDLKQDAQECYRFVRQFWNIDEHFSEDEFNQILDRIVSFISNEYRDMLYKYLSLEVNPYRTQRESLVAEGMVIDNAQIGKYTQIGKDFSSYDGKARFLLGLYFAGSDYNRAKEEACGIYSRDHVKDLHNIIRTEFPQFEKLLPIGYKKFLVGYTDYDGMEELDSKALKNAFNGHISHCGSSLAADFPIRTQIPFVAYDDVGQNRKPPYMLLSSFYSHLYGLVIHNNTVEFMNEIKAIDLHSPVSFELILPAQDSWLEKMFDYAPEFCKTMHLTEVVIDEHYKRKAELDAMTEEEREAIRRDRAKKIIDEILANESGMTQR